MADTHRQIYTPADVIENNTLRITDVENFTHLLELCTSGIIPIATDNNVEEQELNNARLGGICAIGAGNNVPQIIAFERADPKSRGLGLPGGKAEENEDLLKGILREFHEETHVNPATLDARIVGVYAGKPHLHDEGDISNEKRQRVFLTVVIWLDKPTELPLEFPEIFNTNSEIPHLEGKAIWTSIADYITRGAYPFYDKGLLTFLQKLFGNINKEA